MVGGRGRDMSRITVLAVNTEYQARADSHIPGRRSLQEPEGRELNVLDQALLQDVLGAWIGG